MLSIGNKRFVFSGILTLIMVFASWFSISESSPMYGYLQHLRGVGSLLVWFSLPAYIAAALISGNAHMPDPAIFWLTMSIECFGLASVLSLLVFRKRKAVPPQGSDR